MRRAIALDANYAEAHFVLGTALRRLGRTEEATREQKLSVAIQEKQQADYSKKLGVQ